MPAPPRSSALLPRQTREVPYTLLELPLTLVADDADGGLAASHR
jgi:hypothetical protein